MKKPNPLPLWSLVGYFVLVLAGGSPAFADGSKVSYTPATPDTPTVTWKKVQGPYVIALSNSFFGNAWRAQMLRTAEAYVRTSEIAPYIKKYNEASAGQDVSQQIAQINQMVLSGANAIIVDAATSTGLNSVIQQAESAGVLIVSFDNLVTAPGIVKVTVPTYDRGTAWAQWIVKKIDGKGVVLINRGVAGASAETELYNGSADVLKKYPGIKLVEVTGNWDDGTSQKVVSAALAANPKINAVISQGGDQGVVRAFLQAGRAVPPYAGEASGNGFRKIAAQNGFAFYSIANTPSQVAVAIRVAISLLNGEAVPESIKVPFSITTDADRKAGVNYFPDLPDDTIAAVDIPGILDISPDRILGGKN